MAAFKRHVAFGFWSAPAMKDPAGLFASDAKKSPYAIKASSGKDLPLDKLPASYVQKAVRLNVAGLCAITTVARSCAPARGHFTAELPGDG